MMTMRGKPGQDGFTVPELLVATVVTGILVGVIFGFAFIYIQSTMKTQLELITTSQRMSAVDTFSSFVGESSGLIIQNSIPDTNSPYGSNLWPVIHPSDNQHYSNPPGTPEPIAYFKKHTYKTDGTIALQPSESPYEDEYVIYLDETGQKLYLRALANPDVSDNAVLTTCPPASATTSCPADKMLMEHVTGVDFAYLSKDGSLLDYYTSPDPDNPYMPGPDFPVVEVAEFWVNLSARADFQSSNTTNSRTYIRIALRNA